MSKQIQRFEEVVQEVIKLGRQWLQENPHQYLTEGKLDRLGITGQKAKDYLEESKEYTGHECHFQWTRKPDGKNDWCLYLVLALYDACGWPIHWDIDQVYKLASAKHFLALASSDDCPPRWKFFRPGEENPQPGDIFLLKGHGALVTGYDPNQEGEHQISTLEGNLTKHGVKGALIIERHRPLDDKILGFIRPIRPAKG